MTFLFTDVEGSTRLLHELGPEEYAAALAEHRRVIREACAETGGVEVDTQGDAFFFAFPSALGATASASAFTQRLASGPIKVRVGLHSGAPLLTDEGYVGDDVHFAARVAAAGHGGQVVLSKATADLVDVELTDLGEHRLKDIEHAVSLYQLGEGSFPPLKTISNTNLPRPASSFLGRERELEEVVSKIEHGARLLTLTGPGGTGKTRLALEAASSLVGDYKAGVFWVGLASLQDPTLVTETIAQTLGAKDGLVAHIGERELLLLLDNLEQVVEAAPELSSLLSACSNLTLLATSRELLRISGEVEYAVPPLAEPEAVSLFCERSQLSPSEEIAELCARLDSLPLAVELAAARTKALSPAQILERLAQRLDLLKGGRDADPRQLTLRATIEWSYDLLTPEEQELFARLSVFVGGCTLEAAEEVADADLDTLQSLVEKSLLRFTNERYWMLETIREYAGERLADVDRVEIGRRHAEWFGRFAEAGAPGSREPAHGEADNIRAALTWSRELGDGALELRLAYATRRYWANSGQVREGLAWLLGAAERGPLELAEQRAMVLTTAAYCALRLGDVEQAVHIGERQLAISTPLGGNVHGAGLGVLATAVGQQGAFDRSRALFERAVEIAREQGPSSVLASALFNLGELEYTSSNFPRSLELSREALDVFARVGDAQGEAHARIAIGRNCLHLNRIAEGVASSCEGLRRVHALAIPGLTVVALISLAQAARLTSDDTRVAQLLGAAGGILQEIGESLESADSALFDSLETQSRQVLGDDDFVSAWTAGKEMSLDDVVEFAVASID